MNEDKKKIDMNNTMVECTIKRDGLTSLMIDTLKYVWYPNQRGHLVCQVEPVAHRQQLYVTPGCIRPYNPQKDYSELFGTAKKSAPAAGSGKKSGSGFEAVGTGAEG
jgi:hypothetical protein